MLTINHLSTGHSRIAVQIATGNILPGLASLSAVEFALAGMRVLSLESMPFTRSLSRTWCGATAAAGIREVDSYSQVLLAGWGYIITKVTI